VTSRYFPDWLCLKSVYELKLFEFNLITDAPAPLISSVVLAFGTVPIPTRPVEVIRSLSAIDPAVPVAIINPVASLPPSSTALIAAEIALLLEAKAILRV
jgi:hypothetical protein